MYFFKENFEVFNSFKKFKAHVKKESGLNMKVMRSNRESEFTSKEFEEYYKNHWINWPLMVPYFP